VRWTLGLSLFAEGQRGDGVAEVFGQFGDDGGPVVFGGDASQVRHRDRPAEGLGDLGEAEQFAQLRRLMPISA